MRTKLALAFALSACFFTVRNLGAQDLDPNIRKISDGIYVYVAKISTPTAASFSLKKAWC
jgi:hypothetical protein